VLGRAVYCVQDQRVGARVDELMLRAGWHNYQIARLDVLIFPCNRCFADAGSEGEDLVDGVYLPKVRVQLVRLIMSLPRLQCRRQQAPSSGPVASTDLSTTLCETRRIPMAAKWSYRENMPSRA